MNLGAAPQVRLQTPLQSPHQKERLLRNKPELGQLDRRPEVDFVKEFTEPWVGNRDPFPPHLALQRQQTMAGNGAEQQRVADFPGTVRAGRGRRQGRAYGPRSGRPPPARTAGPRPRSAAPLRRPGRSAVYPPRSLRRSSHPYCRARAGRGAPSALESANVDLGKEFTDMIITQLAFSANSRVITTVDDMLDELIRIRR